MNHKIQDRTLTFLLGGIILLFLCLEIILNLTPPVSRDALIHHLAIPKLWLRHGGFYEIPWAEFSYYPMNIDLLYLICLYFRNDIVPKFIHLGFGLGTGWLIYQYLKQRFNANWGLLGMVIFITTPIVIWLSTSAYIDLGMTFFTTSSILAFIRWRDSEYQSLKWLVISSICMGIAIGSKYNSLIAFLFMNLILMHGYAKDTKKQVTACRYGLIFFAITALVASPWYLKNYILTGNPFYPLFNRFIQSLHQQPVSEVMLNQIAPKNGPVGFFRMREIMYGETFWETLLIPIRMFFQGDDHSYRYFQGVLNPLLIVFLPFILLDKANQRDKSLFALFSGFFIATAFFLTFQQVRYILPVLPLLAILAVMGIKNVADRLKALVYSTFSGYNKYIGLTIRMALFAGIGLLLACNFLYLNTRITIIRPLPFVLKQETRNDFLRRTLSYYGAVEYINTHLSRDAKILTMFLGRRGYYLDRSYMNEPSFGRKTIECLVQSSTGEEEFKKYIRTLDFTHILMRSALVDMYLQNNFSSEKIERFVRFARKFWKQVYASDGYSVWDIQG